MRCAGQVARIGQRKIINPYRVLVSKSEEKRPLERPASCWEDSKMNLGERGLHSSFAGHEEVASIQREEILE
jgi:hypothetical protein